MDDISYTCTLKCVILSAKKQLPLRYLKHERMLHKSDKGVMGWKNNEQSYKIIVHKHTHSPTTKRYVQSERQKKKWWKTVVQQQ